MMHRPQNIKLWQYICSCLSITLHTNSDLWSYYFRVSTACLTVLYFFLFSCKWRDLKKNVFDKQCDFYFLCSINLELFSTQEEISEMLFIRVVYSCIIIIIIIYQYYLLLILILLLSDLKQTWTFLTDICKNCQCKRTSRKPSCGNRLVTRE